MWKFSTFASFIFVILACFLTASSQLVNPCSVEKNKDLFTCNIKNNCNPVGTGKVLSNGCLCKPNVVGFRCDRCRSGFYDFDNGCKECDCGPKQLGFRCDPITGACLCKPTVDGKQCLHIQK